MSINLTITDYSDKSFVVRGDTKIHKEELKRLSGLFNANLRDGAGWIFSKSKRDDVEKYISSGVVEKKVDKPTSAVSTSSTVARSVDKSFDNEALIAQLEKITMRLKDIETQLSGIARAVSVLGTARSQSNDVVDEECEEEPAKPKRLLR
jgi:hypothetical protein